MLSNLRLIDEGMDIFLLVITGVFIFAMLGGALVTTFFAALILFAITGLVGFGILSVSVLAGLYARSVSAVFKTFVVICFALCSGVCGLITVFLAKSIFNLSLSPVTLYTIGAASGVIAGMLLGFGTYHLFQTMLRRLLVKLKPSSSYSA